MTESVTRGVQYIVSVVLESHSERLDASVVPSFREVYAEHCSMVFRTIRILGVPTASVEDVAQEVFLSVHRALPSYEPRAPMRAWIYRIARNAALNGRRISHHDAFRVPFDESLKSPEAANPERSAAANERLQILRDVLASMPSEQRDVIVMGELEGFTAPEIAEVLGVGLNTIYSRQRLAREALESALQRRARVDERESR